MLASVSSAWSLYPHLSPLPASLRGVWLRGWRRSLCGRCGPLNLRLGGVEVMRERRGARGRDHWDGAANGAAGRLGTLRRGLKDGDAVLERLHVGFGDLIAALGGLLRLGADERRCVRLGLGDLR